jgi:hypothetical protein
MLKNKYLLFILFFLLFGVLGLYREYFFGNYNNVMYFIYNGKTTVPVRSDFQMFLGLSYKTVYYLKYIFTLVFFTAFFILSYLSVKVFTGNKKILKWFTYSYLVLLLLSSVLMLWTYFFRTNFESDEYSVSRWLMGIAQSPLPALFFIATAKLNEELRMKNEE